VALPLDNRGKESDDLRIASRAYVVPTTSRYYFKGRTKLSL